MTRFRRSLPKASARAESVTEGRIPVIRRPAGSVHRLVGRVPTVRHARTTKWFPRIPRTAEALPRGHRTALHPNFEYRLVQAYRPPESIVIRPSVGPRRRRISTSPTPRIFSTTEALQRYSKMVIRELRRPGIVPGSRTSRRRGSNRCELPPVRRISEPLSPAGDHWECHDRRHGRPKRDTTSSTNSWMAACPSKGSDRRLRVWCSSTRRRKRLRSMTIGPKPPRRPTASSQYSSDSRSAHR